MKKLNRNLTLALLTLATTTAFAAEHRANLVNATLEMGYHARGSMKSLEASDNQHLMIGSVSPAGRHVIDWTATYHLDPRALDKGQTLQAIRIDVEANITPVQHLQIRAYNFEFGQWDFIEYQFLKSSDSHFTTLLDKAYFSPDGKVAINFRAEGKRLMMLRTDRIAVTLESGD
ncbi:MAG TPA: hypothetical protein PLH94_02025 [Fimbriimonadaceae bacterium]|nr:hypothetical protein [Fimbriimonadaceae bacterium]